MAAWCIIVLRRNSYMHLSCPARVSIMAPRGGRSGQICNIFEILGEAGDINNSTSMPNYCDGPHNNLGAYVKTRFLARGPCFASVVTCVAQGRLSWLPRVAIWADFDVFHILGEVADINNSTSMPNYCDGPHLDLGVCVNKVLSAWTEVWTGSWPSRASIMAPGGRDLGGFLRFWACY